MIPKLKRIHNPKLLKETRTRPCLACGHSPSDAAHVKSKGSGGDDVEHNVIPLCRSCHRHQHSVGWSKFLERNNRVYMALTDLGWYIDAEGHFRHDKIGS